MSKATQDSAVVPLIIADVYELAGRFRDRGEEIARKVGQTQARWQVMSVASGRRRTVAQIARRLGVSRQNVQRIADLLVGENWAEFEPNPDHSNSPFVVLNTGGRAALAQITSAATAYHAAVAATFTTAELKSIHRNLGRLLEAANGAAQTKESRS